MAGAEKTSEKLSHRKLLLLATGLLLAYIYRVFSANSDFLNGFSSDVVIAPWQMQVGAAGFCMSPLVSQIRKTVERGSARSGYNDGGYEYTFEETGGINEEDYDKSSIYSILYALYRDMGESLEAVDKDGRAVGSEGRYEFTFNTWGVAPSMFGDASPQRFGQTSYSWFSKSEHVKELVRRVNAEEGRRIQIVEIGCGTGAGADWLSRKVFPDSNYTAIDMQKAAIQTCKRRHSSAKLDCVHLPEGVGNYRGYQPTSNESSRIVNTDGSNSETPDVRKRFGQGEIPLAESSVDLAIILETHIADERIGAEEKAIFAEIRRVLKPGGLFLWGNAIPTNVWGQAERYLPTAGFSLMDQWNNTAGAIQARIEDQPRVELVMRSIKDQAVDVFNLLDKVSEGAEAINSRVKGLYRLAAGALGANGAGEANGEKAFKVSEDGMGSRCWYVLDKLIRNFYRDPGTALYLKMVEGHDSYMHYVYKLEK